ncbi:PREDICTED: RING finger protein 10-like [Priapulus caudatus]|uniref:RING finger protein 10-like n=1 Tax=Priapulus caudatus TaxID=37621 RepID=A0ABM1EYV8_PRICU|nr:PREDICTED: RING finger protein 10-like [Priapulus caudatus]
MEEVSADVDGAGATEEVSADVDGAGATEEVDADVDGAGATEEVDADVDGAGATEEVDADVDGAGATEEVDADVDGAGSFDGSPPPEFNVADIPVVPSSVCLGSLVVEAEGATEQRAEPSRGNVPKDNFYFYQGEHDVRQRLRYLQHLPLTCEFQLAELHLRSPLVSRRTLEFFADDLHRRTQERQRRARDERRRESALRERADARMGRYPSARVSLTSRRDFPEYNATGLAEDCFPPVVCMSPPSAGLSVSPGQPTVSTSPGSNVSSDGGVPSFAQMLRAGEKKADQWPAAKTTVAGERAWPVEGAAGYDDDGGEYAAPEYQSSYADAIALALEKLEVSKQSVGADVAAAPSSGGKKKRGKKKQVTLFSTSMACSKK